MTTTENTATARGAGVIQRFNNRAGLMNPEVHGLYVRHEDHAAALRQALEAAPSAPTVEQSILILTNALIASKGWMRDYADSIIRDAIDRKPLPECVWTSDEDGTWGTGCGGAFVFNDAGPKENNFRHCCYCGGKLVEHSKESS